MSAGLDPLTLDLRGTHLVEASAETLTVDVRLEGPEGPWATFRWVETPVPGGPVRRTPRGGSMPSFANKSGRRRGASTISRTWAISVSRPPSSS